MALPKPDQAKPGQSPDAKPGLLGWIRFNRTPGQAPAAKPVEAPAKPGQALKGLKPGEMAIPSAKSIQSFERLIARQRASEYDRRISNFPLNCGSKADFCNRKIYD